MRHFLQNVLVGDNGKTIIERVYSTGEVEYWSVMSVGWQNGAQQGNAQVPFRIDIGVSDEDIKERVDLGLLMDYETYRTMAFLNFDAALKAAEPEAHASIKEKLQEQAKANNAKLIMANAIPNIPIPRMNGNGR